MEIILCKIGRNFIDGECPHGNVDFRCPFSNGNCKYADIEIFALPVEEEMEVEE